MLIRSQTKAILMNFTNISYLTLNIDIVNNKCKVQARYMTHITTTLTLGTYSSAEKAYKVLDMIQEFYNDTMHYQSAHYASSPTLVFQMPQEEEVNEDMGR